MYLSYFGLTEKPFNITPDPRFLYMSDQHRDALAHLLFSTDESSSFIVLTGEVGTGKTTVCRSMLEEGVAGSHFALILNPMQSPLELLASACDEFGIGYPENPGVKDLVDGLNRWLLALNAANEQAILVIDEAQNLGFDTLEQVRLLTNLETGTKKLLKIILIGQPELRDMLSRPELRQLSQRVTARFHLGPMSADETAAYLRHRLKIAGVGRSLFSAAAIRLIHRHSRGIPRRINLIADRALTAAYARQQDQVDARLLRHAATEVSGRSAGADWSYQRLAAILATVLLLALLGWLMTREPATLVDEPGNAVPATTRHDTLPPTVVVDGSGNSGEYLAALELTLKEERDEPTPADSIESPSTIPPIATLFALWGLSYDDDSGVSACDQADAQGLQCLYVAGGVGDFLRYDRPTLIETGNDNDNPEQWLIRSMDNDGLLLSGATDTRIISRGELEAMWPGKFLLLWRAPPSGSHLIRAGSPAADARWLWQRLQLAGFVEEDLPDDGFDATLTTVIRNFQHSQSLAADGIAGLRTLLKLEPFAAEYPIPTLQ